MAQALPTVQPSHLNPSELGTKEYWDQYYQNNLDDESSDNEPADPSELESWFDEVNAPEKILEYLTSETFPYSPNNPSRTQHSPSILDLGTGNGGTLFQLRIEGGYTGLLVGIDYSQQSVDLAKRLWKGYVESSTAGVGESPLHIEDVSFQRADLIHDDLSKAPWWPDGGFDLVHDKGTFDAISLSHESVTDDNGVDRRASELYPGKVARLVKPGGYLLITSCNWTENELRRWFLEGDDVKDELHEYGRVKYPIYEFGGRKGQAVASICFRRVGG